MVPLTEPRALTDHQKAFLLYATEAFPREMYKVSGGRALRDLLIWPLHWTERQTETGEVNAGARPAGSGLGLQPGLLASAAWPARLGPDALRVKQRSGRPPDTLGVDEAGVVAATCQVRKPGFGEVQPCAQCHTAPPRGRRGLRTWTRGSLHMEVRAKSLCSCSGSEAPVCLAPLGLGSDAQRVSAPFPIL